MNLAYYTLKPWKFAENMTSVQRIVGSIRLKNYTKRSFLECKVTGQKDLTPQRGAFSRVLNRLARNTKIVFSPQRGGFS